MAGLEQLTNKILEDARLLAEKTVRQAEEEAQSILDLARQRAETECEKIISDAETRARELKERMLSTAELNARKERLKVKQELINQAFEQALERLCSLPEDQYFSLLVDLIASASATGAEEIVLAEHDRQRLPADFTAKVNAKVKAGNLPGSMRLAEETAPIKGGFILKAGKVSVNYSFEAVLKQNYDHLAVEVAGVLFS
ncbi:MAG: V-type ATP synthase subunit E family protein [Limnochordia bacterium]|jgi:V/A-type H+-transporting ATPase subunit E|nr:V-type ATP synthase subunit E family protein [Bacillota bacterium]HOB08233.1 V-type ATP synthase subunit E family protein [Limnochordia bacterium]NLH31026.1 hypothetical protein [Bacillota bacterium]HPT93716.1 V-type ATP synthase subunit E family protein [Limnochordia bacterium]HPZ30360.1 V-type ATP synthase subunit E family protein [Limnochordia bacterium]